MLEQEGFAFFSLPPFWLPDTEGVILSEARPRFRFAPSPSAQVRLTSFAQNDTDGRSRTFSSRTKKHEAKPTWDPGEQRVEKQPSETPKVARDL